MQYKGGLDCCTNFLKAFQHTQYQPLLSLTKYQYLPKTDLSIAKTISFTSNPYYFAINNANKKISASSAFTFKAFKSSAFCFLPSQFFRQCEL